MHRGVVDSVPERKCHKMEQRRKTSDKFVHAAGEPASKPPGMKMEQVSGPTQEYKVINHPRTPGRVAEGYETKTTFHQRDKKLHERERWLVSAARQQQQLEFKSTEKSCGWRIISRL